MQRDFARVSTRAQLHAWAAACLEHARLPTRGLFVRHASPMDEYFDSNTGACLDCPDGSGPAVASTLIVVLLAAASAAAYLIFVRPPQSLFMMSQWLNEMVLLLRALGTGAKIRIGVAFYQCITVVATIYLVDMPDEYHHIMDAFDWLQINWLGALVPEECVGSFELRMVLIVLVPLIVLALTMLVFASVSCFKREPLVNAALNATGPCLLIISSLHRPPTAQCFEHGIVSRMSIARPNITTTCDPRL
jgi:ABC-type multidrug transport system fused ATPase/permease subunit